LSESTFLLLQIKDTSLDGVGYGELVDYNIKRLIETVDTVDGLFLDEGVPEGFQYHYS
jgi:hypothetical protein